MDEKEIETFAEQLQQQLKQLEALEESLQGSTATVVLDQSSVGRLSRMDAMQGQQMAMATERRRKAQIAQIKTALQRIQRGEFGYCVQCEEEIPAGRLAINPATMLCVKCAD